MEGTCGTSGEMINTYKSLDRYLKGRSMLGDLTIDVNTVLRIILET
jgi:hypothetical protein